MTQWSISAKKVWMSNVQFVNMYLSLFLVERYHAKNWLEFLTANSAFQTIWFRSSNQKLELLVPTYDSNIPSYLNLMASDTSSWNLISMSDPKKSGLLDCVILFGMVSIPNCTHDQYHLRFFVLIGITVKAI